MLCYFLGSKRVTQRRKSFWRIGDRSGQLTLMRRIKEPGASLEWECLCDCGNTIIVPRRKLCRNEPIKSCGCLFKKYAVAKPLIECYEVAENGCWNWLGRLSRDGRGWRRHTRAHRAVYEELIGPIPKGYDLHHSCENKLCVNPNHMEPLTPEAHKLAHGVVGVTILRCRAGHALTEDNVVHRKCGRECRACRNQKAREYWHTHIRKPWGGKQRDKRVLVEGRAVVGKPVLI